MIINYGVKGKDRKKLAEEIGTYYNANVVYTGVPKCSYKVNLAEIDRDGGLIIDDSIPEREWKPLVEYLKTKGYKGASESSETSKSSDVSKSAKKGKVATPKTKVETPKIKQEKETKQKVETEKDTIPSTKGVTIDGYEISLPCDSTNTLLEFRLSKIITAKGELFKKAFRTESLEFLIADNKITFKWLPSDASPDEIKAAMQFFSKLVAMLKEHQVTAKERQVENEKYAMRCFLLTLGFIGADYKKSRIILLQNLEGSSAWRVKKDDK